MADHDTRCPTCDLPCATEEEWARGQAREDSGDEPEAWEAEVCWYEHGSCPRPAVDWRERALRAEADLANVKARLQAMLGRARARRLLRG